MVEGGKPLSRIIRSLAMSFPAGNGQIDSSKKVDRRLGRRGSGHRKGLTLYWCLTPRRLDSMLA
ncbi:hypothetical protein Deipe_4166 (plasmid) [Deinococcus peraridilitoris DSM 19664]|uniref:Uncharacterized protein n=1 Tax=Deinococcus peraridilitoris (strain DSM 19664 / LMG 22246 / CIP 109416 / KR-200) TaxID=937777 RepID=L0A6M3_DEIPD|nr:hypothetical protein Deipe_4166 [Deinococcus peraridilitoris DSM 19664]